MNKYIIFVSIFCIGVLVLLFAVYLRIEKSVAKENIFPVMAAVAKLQAGKDAMVQVHHFKDCNNASTTVFVSHTKMTPNLIVQYMEERGWKFIDQFGSSLSFQKSDGQATVGYIQIISKSYTLIKFPVLE